MTACLPCCAALHRLDPFGARDTAFFVSIDLLQFSQVRVLVGPESEGDELCHYAVSLGLDDCCRFESVYEYVFNISTS
jgi:hypothetical protein